MSQYVHLQIMLQEIITQLVFFFFQAEDGIRDLTVTGVQTCALPIYELGDRCFNDKDSPLLTCDPAMVKRKSSGATAQSLSTDMKKRYYSKETKLYDGRSEERRVGKSVDLGGRRIIKKKKKERA